MRRRHRPVFAPFVVAIIFLTTSAWAQIPGCGDCDGDGDLDILDALVAARAAAGLATLSPLERLRCDVSPPTGLSVLDALVAAQHAAGYTVLLDCQPGTSSGTPPEILAVTPGNLAPGGAARGVVELGVDVRDAEGDPVDVLIEWRDVELGWMPLDGGQVAPWRFLTTSPSGAHHDISWSTQVGLPAAIGRVEVRVTAFDPAPSVPVTTSIVLDNLSDATAGGSRWRQPPIGAMGGIAPSLAARDQRADRLRDGRIVITGGVGDTGAVLARTLVYDPLRHTIRQVADLPGGGRVGHVSAVLDAPGWAFDGWLLVAGGFDGARLLDDVQLLNPQTMTWATAPFILGVALPTGEHLGGMQAGGRGDPSSPSAWVGAARTLTTGPLVLAVTPPAMPAVDLQTNVGYQLALDPDGDGDLSDSTVVPLYYNFIRELDEEFSVTQVPGADRVRGTNDDRLVVFGGAGVQVDPITGFILPPLNAPPGDPVPLGCVLADAEIVDLVTLQIARVPATAHYDSFAYITQAISIAPPSGDWDHPSLAPRFGHDAVVLADGRLLIAGGINAGADITGGAGDVAISPSYDLQVATGTRLALTARTFTLRPDPAQPSQLGAWLVEAAPYPADTLVDPADASRAGYFELADAVCLESGLGLGGQVLLAGGDDLRTPGLLASRIHQLYDPTTAVWTLEPLGAVPDGMLQARALHAQVPLIGGGVLVWSGAPSAGVTSVLPSFEIYLP